MVYPKYMKDISKSGDLLKLFIDGIVYPCDIAFRAKGSP